VACAFEQQGPRQSAGTRTDFDHAYPFQRTGSPGDAPRYVEIEQKILAERFSR
jgi:hypothetical protein